MKKKEASNGWIVPVALFVSGGLFYAAIGPLVESLSNMAQQAINCRIAKWQFDIEEQAAEHGAYLAEYTQPLWSAVPDKIPGARKVSGVPLCQFLPAAVVSCAGPFLCKDRCAGEKLAQLCIGDRDVVGAAEIPHEAYRLVEDFLRVDLFGGGD